jgi:hypothetical protein
MNSDPKPDRTLPASRVVEDEQNERAPRPARHYKSPDMLVADESLSDSEKIALLQDWDVEADNRLKAEGEGMSASDPMLARREARLAEESARVKTLLTELTCKVGQTS